MKSNKIAHTLATYHQHGDKYAKCDIKKLALILAIGIEEVPKRINDKKAMEIHLLAVNYLRLLERGALKSGGKE